MEQSPYLPIPKATEHTIVSLKHQVVDDDMVTLDDIGSRMATAILVIPGDELEIGRCPADADD